VATAAQRVLLLHFCVVKKWGKWWKQRLPAKRNTTSNNAQLGAAVSEDCAMHAALLAAAESEEVRLVKAVPLSGDWRTLLVLVLRVVVT
jgi:hypothetical protein